MNEEQQHAVESTLLRITPRSAPTHLRELILDSVEKELRRFRVDGRWFSKSELRCCFSLSVLLLISLAISVGVAKNEQIRATRIFGERTMPMQLRELANSVAAQGGPESARWLYDYWRTSMEQRESDTYLRTTLKRSLGIDSDVARSIGSIGNAS